MPTEPDRESLKGDPEIGHGSSGLPQPGAASRRGPTGLRMPDGTEPRSAAFRRIARSLGPYRKLRRAAREESAGLPEPAPCPPLPDDKRHGRARARARARARFSYGSERA